MAYLVALGVIYSLYHIDIWSTNQFNMGRGAHGGLFLSFGILFFVGAMDSRFTLASLLSLVVFMLGFALGRGVSVLIEGAPSAPIMMLLACELFYTAAGVYAIRQELMYSSEHPLSPYGSAQFN